MTEQIQNVFFSKDNIAHLNKLVIQQSNLSTINRDGKQAVVNTLVKNMKAIYKSIDFSKINSTNFQSVFEQFKKHSVSECLNDIKKSNIMSEYSQSAADLKFQRDFKSSTTDGNKFIERPATTAKNTLPEIKSNDYNDFSSLHKAFQPITDDISNQFEKFESGKIKSGDIKFDEIQNTRNGDLLKRNRPATPEFLKGKSTSIKPTSQPIQQNNLQQQSQDQGFLGLANDIGGDLFSLDNIDKPLVDIQIQEDTRSFDERLKGLQSERGNVRPQSQSGKIDFTSPNFKTDDNIQSNQISTNAIPPMQEHVKMQQQLQHQEQNKNIQIQEQQKNIQLQLQLQQQQEQQKQLQLQLQEQQKQLEQQRQLEYQKQVEQQKMQQEQQRMQQQRIQQEQQRMQQEKQFQYQIPEPKLSPSLDNIANSLSNGITTNIPASHLPDVLSQNIHLKKELDEYKKSKIEIDKMNEIKAQITTEFGMLSLKQQNLSLKEMEIKQKEAELIKMISNYNHLFKIEYMQLEISDKECRSVYSYPLNNITNVTAIKLISYSLPQVELNVEEGKNNELILRKDDKEYKMSIDKGKYSIEKLMETLNSKIIEQKLEDVKFMNDINQHIILESKTFIDIIPTNLTKYNLGFINDAMNANRYISTNMYDLRVSNKIYLHIDNISPHAPMGVLFVNGQSNCEFKFRTPISLNILEIKFKDSKGYDYNFYNLPHSLSFVLERMNGI
jgi:hypothetical protein